jgi:hypothetical protein
VIDVRLARGGQTIERRPSKKHGVRAQHSAKPVIPRGISVRPMASQTRTLAGKAIIAAPEHPAPAAALQPSRCHRPKSGNHAVARSR